MNCPNCQSTNIGDAPSATYSDFVCHDCGRRFMRPEYTPEERLALAMRHVMLNTKDKWAADYLKMRLTGCGFQYLLDQVDLRKRISNEQR